MFFILSFLRYLQIVLTFLISGHLLKILYFLPGDSSVLDIVDIDKDNGNPQMCASYVVEIYSNLMASEVCCCILIKTEILLSCTV